MGGGAGGNRTLVRQVNSQPATTIPEIVACGYHPAGSVELMPSAGSFSDVSGLSRLSVVFPYRPPLLLLPGCSDQAPRSFLIAIILAI